MRYRINKGLLIKNLKELDVLNRTTGGHAITLQGIQQLVTDRTKIYHIVDLGCGSGDPLRAVADWASEYKFKVKLTGVDNNTNVIMHLVEHCSKYPEITGIISDYQ